LCSDVLDINCDPTLFISPLVGTIEDYSVQTNSKDELILDSLFSPPFHFTSPMTPFPNPLTNTEDINYLTTNHIHSSNDTFS
jgi:hypothetical protein